MVTGIAVLGVLAGSLASFFRLQAPSAGGEGAAGDPTGPGVPPLIGAELTRLADLRDRGVLSDAELAAEKARLLAR
jgi:hypothetical protein